MNKLLYRGQSIFKDVSWKCTNAVGNENTNQAKVQNRNYQMTK